MLEFPQSGVLLLCKEVLRQQSLDELLLYEHQFQPVRQDDGTVKFAPIAPKPGKRSKTIDREGIKWYFAALELDLNRKRLDDLAVIRNDIEHYAP
jgi:hypothetical protein